MGMITISGDGRVRQKRMTSRKFSMELWTFRVCAKFRYVSF